MVLATFDNVSLVLKYAFKDAIKTESYADGHFSPFLSTSGDFCHLLITFANILDPDQD